MSSSIASLRAAHARAGVSFAGRRAVVGGGTSGIGRGAAVRLASLGFDVAVLGRSAAAGADVVSEMRAASGARPGARLAFVPFDGFSLASARAAAGAALAALGGTPVIDVLFMSQGMATLQGRTETADGIDEKLSLHVYSRVALALELLPALRAAPAPRVISVLSAGVHGVYAHWREDPSLKTHYSIKNAADAAGLLNDACWDALSREEGNQNVLFVHAAPGGVATNWGTEFPWFLRLPVRAVQWLLRSPADAAEAMLDTLWATSAGGFRLVGANGEPANATSVHEEARESLWAHAKGVVRGRLPAVPAGGITPDDESHRI